MPDRQTQLVQRYTLSALAVGLLATAALFATWRWVVPAVVPKAVWLSPVPWVLIPVAALAIVLVPILPFGLAAWRHTDETAREAQKTACFWGAPFGAVIGLVGLQIANALNLHAALVAGTWHPGQPAHTAILPMLTGAMIVIAAEVVVSLLVWAVWWQRHR